MKILLKSHTPPPLYRFLKTCKHLPGSLYKETRLALRRPRYNSKVFCIGYNKTGTTSLGKSLEMLGYRNTSFNKRVWRNYYLKNRIVKLLRYTAKFDSTDDLPWLKESMIPVLDKVFPGSRFIYLTRDDESWKRSYYNWRYKVFGHYPDIEKEFQAYKEHEKFVFDYFRDKRKDRFLVLEIEDEMGFKKLADFLGKETQHEKFPHVNKT